MSDPDGGMANKLQKHFLSFPASFVILWVIALALGCAGGKVKGPVGQNDKGVGVKVPVLDLLDKETYKPESLSPDNLDGEAFHPIGQNKDPIIEQDEFSRYDEANDAF